MNHKYPKDITVISLSAQKAVFKFTIDPDLFWFKGHFDDFPLLAGVAQIDWVMMLLKKHFPEAGHFSGIQQVKYQQPIFPKEEIMLTLSLNEDHSLLTFEYQNKFDIKSVGKINLTNTPSTVILDIT